jgi:hypothetical protein
MALMLRLIMIKLGLLNVILMEPVKLILRIFLNIFI